MATEAPAARPAARTDRATLFQRTAFIALLAATPLLGHLSSDRFDFPAVTGFWALPVFGVLMLLPFVGTGTRMRLLHLDLLVMLSFLVALGFERPGRAWPVLLIYPPLAYLGARAICMARRELLRRPSNATPWLRLALPRSWLVVAIVVLAGVHVSWALEGTARSDVARGGVQGASAILHGHPLYGAQAAPGAFDPHTDTYAPANYEAYLPLTAVSSGGTAAEVTTLFFDLLTALLLFALGCQLSGRTAGVLLAYCWLAFPFTLYEDALGFNDSIVAAALVGTLLLARSPARRGAMAALAGFTKLSPLALVPLLADYAPSGRPTRREVSVFTAVFALAGALIFAPVLAHGSLSTFVARTFGFQAQRTPALSIWAVLQGNYSVHAPWIGSASRVIHGLLAALTGALLILVVRIPRRRDVAGLSAASAAVLIALQLCLSYYSFSYILWFAPLMLVALLAADASGVSARR